MLNPWNAVATLDRMFDDVMGAAFGTATNSRTFDPAVDVRTSDTESTWPGTCPASNSKTSRSSSPTTC
jgi:hypothetical protein